MKTKKWLAALLAAVMLIAAFGPATAFAEAHVDIQDWNGWNYRYYLSGYIELNFYNGSARDLTVPDNMRDVPVCGFVQRSATASSAIISGSNVESITFQLRVTELPPYFASNCSNLERVSLPDELVTIGTRAFDGCSALTDVNLPAGLRTIGIEAFQNCQELKSVTLPSSLRSLGNDAFNGCSNLQTVTVKEGVQHIGAYAFRDCTSLGSITLPDSVVSLGDGVFYECTALTKAELPKGLQGIASELFYNCWSLATCDIPSSVRLIYEGAFYKCKALKSVTLPAGLTTLEDFAFAETGLTSVFIPGGVTNIGANAFNRCGDLKNVTVGYGVRTIGESIFYYCSQSITVTLPASVIEVYGDAFPEGDGVKKYFDGEKRLFDRVEFKSASDKSGFKYRVPVSFVTERGETPAAVSPYVGETVTLPVLTAKGYTFLGWKLGAKTYTDTYTAGTEGVTLTAKWKTNNNNVTFFTPKGETPDRQTVPSGNKVSAPAGQTAGGEYLVGWYKTPDCSGEPYDFNEPVFESFTLYAKWTSAPLITVNVTGAGTVVFRDKNNIFKIFSTFSESGWARVPADAVMEILSANSVVYSGAIISEIPLGNGMFELRTVDIINEKSLYTPNYGSQTTVNITFTEEPRIVADVVGDDGLNTDGLWTLKDGYDPPHTFTNGSPVTVADSFGVADPRDELTLTLTVPEGYGCDGTIYNGDSVTPVYEGKTSYCFTPQGVVTLNLHYYKKANYVTLTFDSGKNDGRFITQKYPRLGTQTVEVPACPFSYPHDRFLYWSADVGEGTQHIYKEATVSLPAQDTVFTAVWQEGCFVKYNGNGNAVEGTMADQFAPYATEMQGYFAHVLYCSFTRSGHVFTGWNTKKNGSGTTYQMLDEIVISENTTLYAQWAQAWTVRLHPNYDGGDDYVPQEIERGTSAALNAPFTREGYVFAGWNTEADGSGTFYAPGETITPTRDISLYAQWHEHDYRFDSFVWAADGKTAQAKLVCAGDETHVVYEAAEMTAYAQEASCEADACTFYEAFYGDNCDTRTVTEEGSALGHDYGQPEWKWTSEEVEADAGDGETMIRAEMEVTCSRCGETFTMEADVEGETTAQPTETEPGQITYTAIAFIDDTEYTAEETEAIPALGLPADEAAEALIAAIGEVTYTPDCKAAIKMARAVYDSLTADEQGLVDNYDVLTKAEEDYAALEQQVQPEETLDDGNVTLSWTKIAYTGEDEKPAVTVTNAAGDELIKDFDYTLTVPAESAELGSYTVTVEGIGRYEGTVTKTYTIVPAQVTGLTLAATAADKVALTWEPVPGAVRYLVYSSTSPSGPFKAYIYTSSASYIMNSYKAAGLYYKVRALVIVDGEKVYGPLSEAAEPVVGCPANLEVTGTASSKAVLTWDAAPGAEKYMIYYSTTENGSYTAYGITGGTTYTMTRSGAAGLYYKVRAFVAVDGGRAYGQYSAAAGPVVGCPADLNVTSSASNKAVLTWEAAPGAEKYMIYYSTEKDGPYTAYGITASTTYTMTKSNAATLYYKVRAFIAGDDARIYGQYSTPVQAQ